MFITDGPKTEAVLLVDIAHHIIKEAKQKSGVEADQDLVSHNVKTILGQWTDSGFISGSSGYYYMNFRK